MRLGLRGVGEEAGLAVAHAETRRTHAAAAAVGVEEEQPHVALLGVAVRAATRGLGPQPSTTHYAFTALAPMPLQLDGELVELAAGTRVSVDIAPRALATVV